MFTTKARRRHAATRRCEPSFGHCNPVARCGGLATGKRESRCGKIASRISSSKTCGCGTERASEETKPRVLREVEIPVMSSAGNDVQLHIRIYAFHHVIHHDALLHRHDRID